jgi:hypothetical protein
MNPQYNVDKKNITGKKIAAGAKDFVSVIIGGVLIIGLFALQLMMAAIPIAIAILIVLWVIRGCT